MEQGVTRSPQRLGGKGREDAETKVWNVKSGESEGTYDGGDEPAMVVESHSGDGSSVAVWRGRSKPYRADSSPNGSRSLYLFRPISSQPSSRRRPWKQPVG